MEKIVINFWYTWCAFSIYLQWKVLLIFSTSPLFWITVLTAKYCLLYIMYFVFFSKNNHCYPDAGMFLQNIYGHKVHLKNTNHCCTYNTMKKSVHNFLTWTFLLVQCDANPTSPRLRPNSLNHNIILTLMTARFSSWFTTVVFNF